MINKALKIIAFALPVSSLILSAYVAYLLFYPFSVLDVNATSVITLSVPRGGTMYYLVDYCRYSEAPAIVYRSIHTTDETSIATFPAVASVAIPGCHKTRVPLQIDLNTATGTYYLIADVRFHVNAIRDIDVVFKTDKFLIR